MKLKTWFKMLKKKCFQRRDLNSIMKQTPGCFAAETVIKINIIFILRSHSR